MTVTSHTIIPRPTLAATGEPARHGANVATRYTVDVVQRLTPGRSGIRMSLRRDPAGVPAELTIEGFGPTVTDTRPLVLPGALVPELRAALDELEALNVP